jgi:zinc and cadmium transporter
MRLPLIVGFSLKGSVGATALAGSFLLFPDKTRRLLIPCLISYATGTLLGQHSWGSSPMPCPGSRFPLLLAPC